MSPRRMDISSLLRDPSPTTDDPPRPRTIDALLHHPDHPPVPRLSFPNEPRQPFPNSNNQRAFPPTIPPAHRPQFLGLDALVHVASEEHRRISAVSTASVQDRDASLVHDHDLPSRYYSYPLPSYPLPRHHHPDLPCSFQDVSRSHKRPCPPSPPRSPSPEPTFPLLPGQPSSPSTRHHPSVSPTNSYPTLRRQPILHMEPTRSAPALLVGPVNDTRAIAHPPSISLRQTSPFSHSLHPSQLSTHSSPRFSSPHRYSPQHLRSQHHSSPIQPSPLIPTSGEADALSPRYGHGPRMAGGIEVLSNDSSPMRDPSRPDFSSYPSPGRDPSTERLIFEQHPEHARYEPHKLSPLSVRAFSLDDDKHQAMVSSHRVEDQESVLSREWVRSRPSHLPFVNATTDNAKSMTMPSQEPDSPAQPPRERHPIRVWEERQTPREVSQRISPARTSAIVSDFAEGRTWLGARETEHDERPTKEAHQMMLRHDVAENVPTPLLSPCKQPPPCESSGSSQTPVERVNFEPQLPISMLSALQTHPSETSLLHLATLHPPASPVPDLHLRNFEIQPVFEPERSETQVHKRACTPLISSDPIITKPVSDKAELTPGPVDADATLVTNRLLRRPSPESVQHVCVGEPGTSVSTHSTRTSRSPSQQSLPVPLPAKDEHVSLPADIATSSPTGPEPASRRSSEPDQTFEQELLVSEQTMMDVDEELLSLVEDRPVPAGPKPQSDSRVSLPTTAGQTTHTSAEQASSEASDGPSLVSSSRSVVKGTHMTDEKKDRASMPPPAARNKKAEKDKPSLTTSTTTGSRKKKDGTSKLAVKPKQPAKTRAKPLPKPKARPTVLDTSSKLGIPKGPVNVSARSRSTSVIPGAMDDVVPEPEADDSDKEDDKLYCVCLTRYDEDRMMIACDRCDEWFHTLCVNMPDLEIDLVDQFICPPCIQKHPHLRTTWKRRCLFGLQHENPSSPEACHKPSRGVFSKYCSDECGIKYMCIRIAQWEKSGGERDLLWECVKNAQKREGVVVCTVTNGTSPKMMSVDRNSSEPKPLDSATKRRAEREVTRLNACLDEVVKERELMKRELDMVNWRDKVVELASERAGKVDECGWDQRLCFGEEEWADFGPEVLESYEVERVKLGPGDDGMPLDATSTIHGEWWCTGKKKCERHAGWQKLRAAEVSFDKDTKEGILLKLTMREREIRKRIEDILYPQPTSTMQPPPHPEVQLNGSEKHHSTGQKGGEEGYRSRA